MKTEDRRVCPSCGNEFSGAVEFCPVCMLHGALADDVESGESSSERVAKPKSQGVARRFQHYELLIGEDGRPLELGRGAMGVTYKAFDVDLRCPVTLKVISEKHLGDESARLRFLREARAAASVRHPNVASVFHLGKSGDNYFYAMEFVEGETLENLVRRTGRLDVKLALEIAAQVAGGLAAVHKKGLVHRDIKPSNIMVNFEDEGAVTAKIIDLGLAKVVNEAGSQTAISIPGGFAGTPEFASPEQFAGVGADIRSDLYSLGVALWEMVTGHVLFRGSPAEVMYQHQHAPLPLEQLESVPQPVVSLIEVLLDKDPKRRFQTPAELLKALPTITGAIDEGRTITYQRLGQMPDGNSYSVARKPPARLGPEKISVARLPITGSDLFGREEDIAFLDEAWANQRVNVVTIVAWAGVGKSVTQLANEIGRSASQVSLNWLRRAVVIPIIGARRAAQIEDNLKSLDWQLTDEQLAKLDEATKIELGFPHDFLTNDFVRQMVFGGTHASIDNHRARSNCICYYRSLISRISRFGIDSGRMPLRRAADHHPHHRARDAEARAVLRDPRALVFVHEAMGTQRASSRSRSAWTSGSAESRDGRRMNSSQVRPHRPCAVRLA